MKHASCRALVLLLALLAQPLLQALSTDIVYTEGDSTVRTRGGTRAEAVIGDRLETGDTVTTGADGFVEMDQAGVSIKVQAKTVFTLLEREQGGRKGGVLSVAVGSIRFRYDRLTGSEPLIQTTGCIAGVRGTELSVYAGADGSSLVVVEQGAVVVEAGGGTVELGPEEGVEVRPGEAPGEKFKVHSDQIDYSRWNEEKLAALQADPRAGIEQLRRRMEEYVRSVQEYDALHREHSALLAKERAELARIMESQGEEAGRRYQQEVVLPHGVQTGNLFLNVRFFSLSALSLRRYVAGRVYVSTKARFMAAPQDAAYRSFLEEYERLLAAFENSIVPQLVETDI